MMTTVPNQRDGGSIMIAKPIGFSCEILDGFGERSVTMLLAIVLLTASLLKAWTLLRYPLPVPSSLLQSRPILLAAIAVECTLGIRLLVDWRNRWVWRIALGLFILFGVVAGSEAVRGQKSCGCFGAVAIQPIYTAALDGGAVVGLVWIGGKGKNAKPQAAWGKGVGMLVLGAWICGIIGIWMTRPAMAAASSIAGQEFGQNGELVVLEPQSLKGLSFALSGHIDVGSTLLKGRWIVLLVHHDCDHCRVAVEKFLAAKMKQQQSHTEPAIVEMSPFADASAKSPWHLPPTVVAGKLDQTRDWFATTPVAIVIHDGIVADAAEGDEATALTNSFVGQ